MGTRPWRCTARRLFERNKDPGRRSSNDAALRISDAYERVVTFEQSSPGGAGRLPDDACDAGTAGRGRCLAARVAFTAVRCVQPRELASLLRAAMLTDSKPWRSG